MTDVQYGDFDDAWDFNQTVKRTYRKAILALERAIDWFLDRKVSFIVNLGDLIDGRNREIPGASLEALRVVMRQFHRADPIPIIHIIGNHDLYNFTRDELTEGVHLPSANSPFKCSDNARSPYYSFRISSKWLGIVLDGYDVSPLRIGGGRLGKELTIASGNVDKLGLDACQSHNPNDLTIYNMDFMKGLPLGVASRWVPYNGGISDSQLTWLNETLQSHPSHHVCVFSHLVIHPGATPGMNCHTLMWNYDEVLEVFEKAGNVRLVLAGHAHAGSRFDDGNCMHVTLPSPLETKGDDCAAIVTLDDETVRFEGRGIEGFEFGIKVSDNTSTIRL